MVLLGWGQLTGQACWAQVSTARPQWSRGSVSHPPKGSSCWGKLTQTSFGWGFRLSRFRGFLIFGPFIWTHRESLGGPVEPHSWETLQTCTYNVIVYCVKSGSSHKSPDVAPNSSWAESFMFKFTSRFTPPTRYALSGLRIWLMASPGHLGAWSWAMFWSFALREMNVHPEFVHVFMDGITWTLIAECEHRLGVILRNWSCSLLVFNMSF